MADDETWSVAALTMDRGIPLGNSLDTFSRRALHVLVGNSSGEPIPVTGVISGSGSITSFIYGPISVTSTPSEAKVGASTYSGRKLITIQPTDGKVWWGADASVSPATGTTIFKNQMISFDFSDTAKIYLVSQGTVDVRISEGK